MTSLVFTSANGVAAFAALTPDRALPVFTVGDATAEAARAAGFAAVRSAGGDIGMLAALLRGRVEAVALPVYEAVETRAPAPDAFDAVLIHSPRAGRALAALGPFPGRTAIAISEAAAAPLGAGSGLRIRVAANPDESALLAALGNPARRV